MTKLSTKSTKNEIGFSVVSDSLHAQLFPNYKRPKLAPGAEQRVRDHYRAFDVTLPPAMPEALEHDWQLPKLQGSNMREHFEAIGKEFAEPYDKLARSLIVEGLPAMPDPHKILIKPGWFRYAPGSLPEQVDSPLEEVYVLDCETYVQRGAFPIIATASSTEAWYVWLDPALCDLSLEYEHNLYKIGSGKLILGHNTSYDFQRCVESHQLTGDNRSYFLDTMGMNIVCNGFSGPQRWVTMAKQIPAYAMKWADKGCSNSLVACYNFHCWPESPLGQADKELRDIFVTQHLPAMRAKFTELINYALLDIKYTHELFCALYPKYRQKRPSWVSLAGVLQQSAHNLPVVDNWFDWLENVETKMAEYEVAIDKAGRDIANGILAEFKSLQLPDEQDLDFWKWHNDLLLRKAANDLPVLGTAEQGYGRLNKWKLLMSDLWLGSDFMNWQIKLRVKHGRGTPEWLRGLGTLGKSGRLLHQLLRFTWDDCPVYWGGRSAKWCYNKDGVVGQVFKFGTDEAGETLLTRDHNDHFKSGDLKVTSPGGDKVLELAIAMTYWVSCRGRAMAQIVVKQEYETKSGASGICNVITPDLVPNGTVSGRGVSPLWLTVTDCKKWNNHKLGVELKSRVQAPPGLVLLQADFSAQELRIGAMYADSIAARPHMRDKTQLGYIGSSLMSNGVHAGNKELGTDPHTMLAKSIGVTRDNAKTAAYAMLYGAGRKTVAKGIMWDYRDLPHAKPVLQRMALTKADEVIAYKKGKALKDTTVYLGGTDSAAFTMLATMSATAYPETPLLKCKLTAPMCPAVCGTDFATGRTNWGIQATARDQADCLMVAFEWLCRKHQVAARHIFMYHDELVVLCDDQDKDIASWLLNVAHAWTWAFSNEAMDIFDMCTVGIWFDDVLQQRCFRKAPNLKTNSPSNLDEQMPDGDTLLERAMPRLNDLTVALGRQVCPELYL